MYTCFSVCETNNYLCLQLILMNFKRRKPIIYFLWKVLDCQGTGFHWIRQMCLIFKKTFKVIEISLPCRIGRRKWKKKSNREKGIMFYIKGELYKTMSKSFPRKWMWIYWLNKSDPIHHRPMNDRLFNTRCFLFLCSHIWHLKETEKHRNPSNTNLLLQQLLLKYMWVTESLEDYIFWKTWHFIRKLDHEVYLLR